MGFFDDLGKKANKLSQDVEKKQKTSAKLLDLTEKLT